MLDHHRRSAWRRPRRGCASGRRCATRRAGPRSFHSLKSSSICQRARASTSASRIASTSGGALVTSSVQSARASLRGTRRLALPLGRRPGSWRGARSATRCGTRTASRRAGSRASTPSVDRHRRAAAAAAGATSRPGRGARRRRRRPPSAGAAATGSRRPGGDLRQHRQAPEPQVGDPQRPGRQRRVLRAGWSCPGRGRRSSTGPSRRPRHRSRRTVSLRAAWLPWGTRPPQPGPDRGQARRASATVVLSSSTTAGKRRQQPRRHRVGGDHLATAPLQHPRSSAAAAGVKRWANPCGLTAPPASAAVWVSRCSVPVGCASQPSTSVCTKQRRRSACCGVGRTRSRGRARRAPRSGRALQGSGDLWETGHAGTSSGGRAVEHAHLARVGPRCHPVLPLA